MKPASRLLISACVLFPYSPCRMRRCSLMPQEVFLSLPATTNHFNVDPSNWFSKKKKKL